MRFRQLCLPVMVTFISTSPVASQHFPQDEDLKTLLRFVVEDGMYAGILQAHEPVLARAVTKVPGERMREGHLT